MANRSIFFRRQTPFIGLFVTLASSILVHWYLTIPIKWWINLGVVSLILLLVFFFLPSFIRFRHAWAGGILVYGLVAGVGGVITFHSDIRNDPSWIGRQRLGRDTELLVALDETPVEKTKSYKSTATIVSMRRGGKKVSVAGRIIIYFSKDSLLPGQDYGSMLLFKKPPQEIRNPGNPGGFDFRRYSLFQGITHQVYLEEGEFIRREKKQTSFIQSNLVGVKNWVLGILREHIPGEREVGLAEALLIGYKNDLDRSLVQSYSNTGVVHVIAISGLHIGLIYAVLLLALSPLAKRRQTRWIHALIIIVALWGFSLLAGAQPSVMRSAVMFTCIVLGQAFRRKSSIYNTMAFSAFGLLCYNPFWLWDAGFQLSYIAVLSIIIFMKPIYHLIYVPNRWIDMVWKLNAITLAAQLLTTPISLFHFHQFPNYFLLTNLVAVPLSSAIVLGEILLCVLGAIPFLSLAAGLTGKLLSWMIGLMNKYIEAIEKLPYSVWEGIEISVAQVILLYLFIACCAYWLMLKWMVFFLQSLLMLLAFFCIRSFSFLKSEGQQRIVVYNLNRLSAIDVFQSRKHIFHGDSSCLEDRFIQNFHLLPSRRLARAQEFGGPHLQGMAMLLGNKRVVLMDETLPPATVDEIRQVDLLILSKSPRLYISKLSREVKIRYIVFDSSVPTWRMAYWKNDCDSLGIPYHDVREKGAFVMNFN